MSQNRCGLVCGILQGTLLAILCNAFYSVVSRSSEQGNWFAYIGIYRMAAKPISIADLLITSDEEEVDPEAAAKSLDLIRKAAEFTGRLGHSAVPGIRVQNYVFLYNGSLPDNIGFAALQLAAVRMGMKTLEEAIDLAKESNLGEFFLSVDWDLGNGKQVSDLVHRTP